MIQEQRQKWLFSKELLFQIVLHILVFIFYAIDKKHRIIETHQFFFFLNYAVAALFINYFLLPRFFYKNKYWQFGLGLIFVFLATIFVEEMILEKIYFPDTKGKKFFGIFYTLIDVIPVTIILSGFKFAWDALIKEREVEDLKLAVKESELQFLKSQVNPHFLFNNLNNLYAYAIENSPKTPEIILELSSVLRYMLYETKTPFVPLRKEIEQMKHFINLNELQVEERGQINFQTQNIRANYQIAPLILIVFIENAFKHSTASLSEDIIIDVNISLSEEGILKFTCRNNHQLQSNTDNLTKGIGLKNVRKRLE
ncbi:MAG: sensor histidine kinase, partial [Saprospiraceae bacterium]